MVWDYSNDEEEILADRWHKKIGSFEAVADDVLMGECSLHVVTFYVSKTFIKCHYSNQINHRQ